MNTTHMGEKRILQGIVSTLAGAIAWGFSGATIQLLFASFAIPPLLLTSIRMLGSGLIFLMVIALTRRSQLKEMLVDAKTRKGLLIFGVVGLFGCSSLYTTTVFHTNAGTATVLQTLNTAFLLTYACIRAKRHPEALELAALICALVATYLIATGADPTTLALSPEGLGFGLATAVAAAFYIGYPKQLFERWGSFTVTGLGMTIGGLAALSLWFLTKDSASALPAISTEGVFMLVVNVIIGTFGAYALFLHGVSLVGPVPASMLGAAEPVSATLFSALWLGTLFSWADWVGLVLMVTTVMLVALQSHTRA